MNESIGTARAELEEELRSFRELNRELDAIIDSSHDGIVVADGEGNLLRVSKSYGRISGVPPEKILGKNMKDVVKEGYVSDSVTLKVLEQRQSITIKQQFATGRESIITGSPLWDERGEIIRVVTNVRDMTEISRLRRELEESKTLLERYRSELVELKAKQKAAGEIIAVSKEMQKVVLAALKSSASDATVLITGESGVGKELVAKLVHDQGPRCNSPYIVVNCGAIPEGLLESELFGYEPGAFSGADKQGKPGLIELADGGSLVLDEVADLPLPLQVKLLRFLEEKGIWRLGGLKEIRPDVRIIASTNRDLEKMVEEGSFRRDLYFRLNVIRIKIPPLRERREDIVPLAGYFWQKYNQQYGYAKKMSVEAYNYLVSQDWPGNVRELSNLLERIVITSDRETIDLETVKGFFGQPEREEKIKISITAPVALAEARDKLERELLTVALSQYGTTRAAAQILGVDHSTVVRKMQKLGLKSKECDDLLHQ
jgi:PAS domain S-box-containing protein